MWVSRGGFPIGLPFGGCHRGTTPQRAPGRKRRAVKVVRGVAGRDPSAPGRKPGSDAHHPPACAKTKPGAQRAKTPQRAPRRKPGSKRQPSRAASSRGEESSFLSGRGQNRRFFAASRPKRTIICAIGKPKREQPAKTSTSHFRDREQSSVLTASDQNRRFFASRTPKARVTALQGGVGRDIVAGKPPRTGRRSAGARIVAPGQRSRPPQGEGAAPSSKAPC